MNGCEYFQELISRMLDEELSGEENAVLAEHLKNCEDCRNMHRAFTMLSDAVAEDIVEAPESIRINVMADIRRAEIIKKNKSKKIRRMFATAACLVLVAGAAYMSLPRMGTDMMSLDTADFQSAPAEANMKSAEADTTGSALPAPEAPAAVAEGGSSEKMQESPAEAVTEEPIQTERAAYSFSLYAEEAAEETAAAEAETISSPGTWEELSALLAGLEADISPEELAAEYSFNVSFIFDNNIQNMSIFSKDGFLYYTDPSDGIFKKSSCLPENLDFFLT